MSTTFISCVVSPQGALAPKVQHDLTTALSHIGLSLQETLPTTHEGVWEARWSGTPSMDHRLVLQALSLTHKCDMALIPASFRRGECRLVVFDMDSTLVAGEVINQLALLAGVGEQVAQITQRAMNGELNFGQSLGERVALLQGLAEGQLHAIEQALPLNGGVMACLQELRRHGIKTAIVTGGFTFFAEALSARLGCDRVYANQLEFHEGVLTGKVTGPVIDGEAKERVLRELAQQHGFDLSQTVAVGDGANDLPMLAAAGLGVAYHAKEKVRRQSPCEIHQGDMRVLLAYLGLPYAV